ncbi:hypothetical protein [Microvirga massiliensis]|uniref:hypothetical protein n=1 Tax=Microvirga massiliensis TaxID=1033741 RepID=UPI00062B67C5|nr:hypothetical protein [Microvirga massiliensis]
MTPDLLAILRRAAADPEGLASITRPRQGVWPGELHLIRLLEESEHLMRVRLRDSPAEGTVTAVYALTPKGRRAAAEEPKPGTDAEPALPIRLRTVRAGNRPLA